MGAPWKCALKPNDISSFIGDFLKSPRNLSRVGFFAIEYLGAHYFGNKRAYLTLSWPRQIASVMSFDPFSSLHQGPYLPKGQIDFTSVELDFAPAQAQLLRQWIKTVIQREGAELYQLQYVFCSDAYLYQLNVEYLNHHTLTDIITFPYADPPAVYGDLFISIERIRDNAQSLKVSFSEELRRVMIHGVLHLCGYGDKSEAQAQQMRTKEDEALALLHQLMVSE